ncbi:DNA glycosylase AlkZ-like family protein [Nocardia sp. NPDC057227]|uniref:DNA glycosylase AlkZ-like family protein n=1 Tax=Nocardia sp. NPDC057227 TaxID=3346056 RepID=UPI003627C2CD
MARDSAPIVSVEHPQKLWNWVLAKQGIGTPAKPDSVRAAANRSLGLHAARLSSPLVAAAVRVDDDVDLSPLVGATDDALITIRCMRKTLHTLPFDLASSAHAATRHYRLRDVQRLAVRAEVSQGELTALQEKIHGYLLDAASASHRDVERAVTPTNQSPIPARIALKLLWERGDVVYRNTSDRWLRETRMFSLASLTHPGFITTLEPESARDQLIEQYFQRYGPATVKDVMWWAAIPAKAVVEALAARDVVRMRLPWAPSPFWMLRSDYDAFLRQPNSSVDEAGAALLGHEDIALKAYFESRGRYLGALPARKVFNQIGEVLPSIVHAGRVVGRWQWDPADRRIRYRRFPGSDGTRTATAQAAAALEKRLRLLT